MTNEQHVEYANSPKDIAQSYLRDTREVATIHKTGAQILVISIDNDTYDKMKLTTPDELRAEFAKRLVDDFDERAASLAKFDPQTENIDVKHLLQKAAGISLYPSRNNDILLQALDRLKRADTPDSIKNTVTEMSADAMANLILDNGTQINLIPPGDLREIFAKRLVTETGFHIRGISETTFPRRVDNQTIIISKLLTRHGINALFDLHPSDGMGDKSPLQQVKTIALADMDAIAGLVYKKPPFPPAGIPSGTNI